MNKKEKVIKITAILQKYFPYPKHFLTHTDHYTLLIATLLSARCTDQRVNLITPILFAKASTPQKMIQLSVEDIQKIIRPCGLSPFKSKAIFGLSKILLEEYAGKVPSTFEDLEKLPGVGHKTASVVLSQGFNIPAFPVDTHIHRLATRWTLSMGKNVQQTEKNLKSLFPQTQWQKIHLQMISFGREFCPARGHKKEICPICSWI